MMFHTFHTLSNLLILILILNTILVNSFIFSKSSLRVVRLQNSIEPIDSSITQMSIDEIISELDLRGVKYDDCLNKSDLSKRLSETRSKGIADPNIISKFNEEVKEEFDPNVLNDNDIVSQVAAKDGTLPGGLSPELVKALTSDPEIMNMLRNPKMQEVMKAVMTQGPDGIKKYLSDPDAMILLQRLSKAMERATKL